MKGKNENLTEQLAIRGMNEGRRKDGRGDVRRWSKKRERVKWRVRLKSVERRWFKDYGDRRRRNRCAEI